MALSFSNRIHMFDDQTDVEFWLESQPEIGVIEIGMDRDGVLTCVSITPEQMRRLLERVAAMLNDAGQVEVATDETYPDF